MRPRLWLATAGLALAGAAAWSQLVLTGTQVHLPSIPSAPWGHQEERFVTVCRVDTSERVPVVDTGSTDPNPAPAYLIQPLAEDGDMCPPPADRKPSWER